MKNAENHWSDLAPLAATRFRDPPMVREQLAGIAACGASADTLTTLWEALSQQLPEMEAADEAVRLLAEFVSVSRCGNSLLSLLGRDPDALSSLLQLLLVNPAVAALLIGDADSFEYVRARDGQTTPCESLRERLDNELRSLTSIPRAATAIGRCAGRELLGIVSDEFVRGIPPDQASRQISQLTDTMLASALNFAIQQTIARWGMPQRLDGSHPAYTIIAMGSYGGEEISYHSPLDLLLLCDRIDRQNESHVRFNAQLAATLRNLLDASRGRLWSPQMRLHTPGGYTANEPEFHDAADAAALYEREDHVFQRLALMKSRVATGDTGLGDWFLQQIQRSIYSCWHDADELAELGGLRSKLHRRTNSQSAGTSTPIADIPGGRRDIELTVQLRQLRQGCELSKIRGGGTLDAIAALQRQGCLGEQDASVLAENLARLWRLEHHLAMLSEDRVLSSEHRAMHLPEDQATRTRLAWRLGVRLPADDRRDALPGGTRGDREGFETRLSQTLAVNRTLIQHLIAAEVANSKLDSKLDRVEIETELMLVPDHELATLRDVMAGHRFTQLDRAIDHLFALSHETVACLSSRRCRPFLAAIAPRLLREIASTPAPDETLARLVVVSNAIGGKATLWDLLGRNDAMLRLLVRLCSLAPYLTENLIENPGTFDELVDALAMDRLPRPERLEMQASRLCQSSDDVRPILLSFQAGCDSMIGVRDLLDKDTVTAIGEALSDTTDTVLRSVIQSEQARLAARFGDPVDGQGNPVEMVALAMGDLGSRERHYHSDLNLAFVYTSEGQTRRRSGSSRTTLSNQHFFQKLAQRVIRQLDSDAGRLYETWTPLASSAQDTRLCQSIEAFRTSFQQAGVPLWQRMAVCQARPCSGSRTAMERARDALRQINRQTPWHESCVDELKAHRRASESAARPDNLRDGVGGTTDVQYLVAAGILQSATKNSTITATGTAAALDQLAAAGVYPTAHAQTLIDNYLYLRKVQTKLGLLNTIPRHELPRRDDESTDSHAMRQLAALLGESDPAEIGRRCEAARRTNRDLFERLLNSDHRNPG